jgi:teichoic acid transport system permease protein
MRLSELRMASYISINNLKRENKGTSLGFLWLIINPLITALTFSLIFGVILKDDSGKENAPNLLWILSGFFAWFFVSDAFIQGSFSIMKNKNLVTKIVFPLHLLPVIEILNSFFKFLILLAIYYVIQLFFGRFPTLHTFELIYAFAAAFIFLIGITRLFSVIVTFYRDFGNFLNSIVQLLMWGSGVLIPLNDNVEQTIQTIIKANPFWYIVRMFRDSLLSTENHFWSPTYYKETIVFWTITVILYIMGTTTFNKKKNDFSDVL